MTQTVSDLEKMSSRLGCPINNLSEAVVRRLENAIAERQNTDDVTLTFRRVYITGEYGQEQVSPDEDSDVLVFVEIGASPTPDDEDSAMDLLHHITGTLHDKTAGEIESALGRPCDIAFFGTPELLDAAGVNGVRPITEAARAACGLQHYKWREDTTASEDSTVYDVRMDRFVPIQELS